MRGKAGEKGRTMLLRSRLRQKLSTAKVADGRN